MPGTIEHSAASERASAPPVSLSVVIPAYNEAENIREAVTSLLDGLPDTVTRFEIIVVDDGSRDVTAAVSRELAAENDCITVLTHDENRGKGAALNTGFARAHMEWVLLMDADQQIDISELGAFLPHTREFDIIAGFRVGRKVSLTRRISSWVFGTIVAIWLGIRLRDLNCPFKLIRRTILTDSGLQCAGFAIDAELVSAARRRGWRIKEMGVACRPRRNGASSVRLRHVRETLRELADIAGKR
jgi:glycosyltransferase involved in cell wall biosynthesis